MSANQVQSPPLAGRSSDSGTVVLSNVCKSYGDLVAVNDLSLSIRPGGIYGLLGPNGAGKTSTIRMIIGIIVPDSGRVSVFGEPLRRDHTDLFGYLPEERGLYKKMKVLEHLIFLGQLKGLTAAEAATRAKSWVRAFRSDRVDREKGRISTLVGLWQTVHAYANKS